MRAVQTILVLVIVATVVAAFANRIRVPAPSLLVVAGLAVALLPATPDVQVSPEVVSLVVLPPLIYAAGEELSWRELKRVWRPVTVLAVGLVLVSAAAVGAVTVAVTGLPWSLAFVLGAVLASTDPVAVAALGRKLALPPRLQTLVQAESLFNDATSLILFRIAVGVAVIGGGLAWASIAADFAVLALGGVAIGVLAAVGAALIRRRTEDPVLEAVTSLVTPYAAFVAAESVHASGVTAVVVAGVILGVLAPRLTNARIRLQLTAVYGTVIFLLESVVFSLIGLQLPGLIRRLAAADEPWLVGALAAAATLIVVRIGAVFALSLTRRSRAEQGPGRWQVPAVVSWAGARGVVPLAAALSIPLVDAAGAPLAGRDLVMVLAIAVIVISLVVQGFTLAPLVRLAGVAVHPADARDEYALGRKRVTQVASEYLDEIADSVPQAVADRIRGNLHGAVGSDEAPIYRRVRRDVIGVQRAELARLHTEGTIGDGTLRRIQHLLDLEEARLAAES